MIASNAQLPQLMMTAQPQHLSVWPMNAVVAPVMLNVLQAIQQLPFAMNFQEYAMNAF